MVIKKSKKGFTLLELTVALAILIIAAAGVFAATRHTERRALEHASLTLQADLRYAQRRSMLEGRSFGVFFEPARNRYSVVSVSPDRIIRTVYLEGGVNIASTSGARLHFLPRGTASGGFTVNLRNGVYWQRLTATVSGGRIQIHEITTTNE